MALKERLTARRVVAALVIVAGVVLLVDWGR
jgi:drug/metabolite transporter (DMT)-like permease